MKPLLPATAAAAALLLAAPSWAQRAEAPLPPPPAEASAPSAVPPPAPVAQQPPAPRIDLPAARQGSTAEVGQPMPPPRRRPHRQSVHAVGVNRALANAYTNELNRRELQALESADTVPAPPEAAPWRELYSPR